MPDFTHDTIGTMGERSLHAALKRWYADPRDRIEEVVDGYHVDIVRGDLLIEIQTRNFSAMKRKLAALLENHRVRLVHPIAAEKWIVRLADDGLKKLGRRKSPKKGTPLAVFAELVSIPDLMQHPNFSLELLLIQEEEVRRKNGRNWRRRGWGIFDRKLIKVIERVRLDSPADCAAFLPPALDEQFTTKELAKSLECTRHQARQVAYCLRKMAAIVQVGKRGNALLYERKEQN